jgi:hypothetical protein
MKDKNSNNQLNHLQRGFTLSSCLAGLEAGYTGTHCLDHRISQLLEENKAIPICPELLDGFTTPREPAIGDEDCMKTTGKLNDKRIPYKTKIRGPYAGENKRKLGYSTKLSHYDIFIKKEFEHKVRSIIE